MGSASREPMNRNYETIRFVLFALSVLGALSGFSASVPGCDVPVERLSIERAGPA
jgi:hypothetical protein